MDFNMLNDSIRKNLMKPRYRHTIGVYEVSIDLALIYGCNEDNAKTAALLHDCAKPLSDDKLKEECQIHNITISKYEEINLQLLHAKVGALYARERYGVEDEDVLNAITYHTTGRPGMSLLEKIIFVADYIEPYRKQLPEIHEIRKAAYNNLDYAIVILLENILKYLKSKNECIDIITVNTFEYYKRIFS